MYCIKCGVELADSEKKCPLCGTRVFHPDFPDPAAPGPYPKDGMPHEEFNRQGVLFILTILFLIPLLVCLICDLSLNHTVVWSGYAAGAMLLGYAVIVLPLWFRSPNPVIFVPVDFAVLLGYLLYIDLATGGRWFLPFAFPVAGVAGGIVCAVIALCRYVRQGYLYIFGGALILSGASMIGMELLLNRTFGLAQGLRWSLYPLTVLVLLGVMLLVIAVCRPIQESLKRRFFL